MTSHDQDLNFFIIMYGNHLTCQSLIIVTNYYPVKIGNHRQFKSQEFMLILYGKCFMCCYISLNKMSYLYDVDIVMVKKRIPRKEPIQTPHLPKVLPSPKVPSPKSILLTGPYERTKHLKAC